MRLVGSVSHLNIFGNEKVASKVVSKGSKVVSHPYQIIILLSDSFIVHFYADVSSIKATHKLFYFFLLFLPRIPFKLIHLKNFQTTV